MIIVHGILIILSSDTYLNDIFNGEIVMIYFIDIRQEEERIVFYSYTFISDIFYVIFNFRFIAYVYS